MYVYFIIIYPVFVMAFQICIHFCICVQLWFDKYKKQQLLNIK